MKMAYLERMTEAWPSLVVARSEMAHFSGGMLSPGTMANYDSRGKGPSVRVRIGRKVGYPKDVLVEWLKEHFEIESKEDASSVSSEEGV